MVVGTRLAFSAAYYRGTDLDYRRVKVTGADALDLLNRLSASEISAEGASSGLFLNEKGRILALYSAAASAAEIILVIYAPDAAPLLEHIARYTIVEDVRAEDCSAQLRQLTLICADGESCRTTGFLTLASPFGAPAGAADGEVCRSEVLIPAAEFETAEAKFAERGLRALSAAEYERLRVESGWHGPRELTDRVNPLEAGLKRLLSFTKGCYIGQEVIARLDTYDKVQRALVRFASANAPAVDAELTQDGQTVGWVTSSTELAPGDARGLAILKKSALNKSSPIGAKGGIINVVREGHEK